MKTFLFQNGVAVLGIFSQMLLFMVAHTLQKHFMEIVIYFQGEIWTSL